VLPVVNAAVQVVATALVGVATVSIIVRLRRAGGVQRQQLKGLASAAVVLAGYYLLAYLYTRSTGASTGAATTPPGPSRRSAPACGTRSTWTP
jgi:hypothetical protein